MESLTKTCGEYSNKDTLLHEEKVLSNDTISGDNSNKDILLHEEKASSKDAIRESKSELRSTLELFEDDGTLDLLRLAVVHPSLKEHCDCLISRRIPEFNSLITQYNDLIQSDKASESIFLKLRSKCLGLWEDLDRDTLTMDCINLDEIKPEWGTKPSIRQARKEIVNICEKLSCTLEEVCKLIMNRMNDFVKMNNELPVTQKLAVNPTYTADPSGPKDCVSKPVKRCLWDVKSSAPSYLGLCASASSVRKVHRAADATHVTTDSHTNQSFANDLSSSPTPLKLSVANEKATKSPELSDGDGEESRATLSKRSSRAKRNRNTDWGARVREKIDYFKEHTSKGGCVTTLYDHPVNRDTMLSLLAKCEPYLSLPDPTPYQMKVCIETFIAGLDTALADLQQLRVNKTQMRLLHQSALVLDTLSTPSQLLPEVKSLQGLLKTFGLF